MGGQDFPIAHSTDGGAPGWPRFADTPREGRPRPVSPTVETGNSCVTPNARLGLVSDP